ncbi:MAG: hypothetical protein WA021_04005, partial [Minisyncoccia bacterium]
DNQSVGEIEKLAQALSAIHGDEDCVAVANAFSEALVSIRSRFAPKDFARIQKSLMSAVHKRLESGDYTLVPNVPGYSNLKLTKPLFMHDALLGTFKIEKLRGVERVQNWRSHSGYQLFAAEFNDATEEWVFEDDKTIILSKAVLQKWKGDLAPFETWMQDLDRTGSGKDRPMRGDFGAVPAEAKRSELAKEMGDALDFFIDRSYEESHAKFHMSRDGYVALFALSHEQQLDMARKETRDNWVEGFIKPYGPDARPEHAHMMREERSITRAEQDAFIARVDAILANDPWWMWYIRIHHAIPTGIRGSMDECSSVKMLHEVERMRGMKQHADMLTKMDFGYQALGRLSRLSLFVDFARLKSDLEYDWPTINRGAIFLETLLRGMQWAQGYGKAEIQAFVDRGYALFVSQIATHSSQQQVELVSGLSVDHIQDARRGAYDKVPKKFRPYIMYLFEGGELLQEWTDAEIEIGEEGMTIPLSQLVLQKRGAERIFSQFRGISELSEFVQGWERNGADPSKALREIQHAVQNQIVNDQFLWVREMIQNGLDAIRTSGRDFQDTPQIQISPYVLGNDLIVEVRDPIGMDFSTVVNYLLVPGESSKRTDDRNIGAFGQGFFTILNGARKVLIKTGTGDGRTTNIELTPVKDGSGNLLDYQIRLEQMQEPFVGTRIQQFSSSESPSMSAAFCKASVYGGGSLINADEVGVRFADKQINRRRESLATSIVPGYGSLTIYAGTENVVTQQGLYIKNIDREYTRGLPRSIHTELQRTGIVIDVPKNIELIGSRADIARKQEVFPILKQSVDEALMNAFLSGFAKGIYDFKALPYDFFDTGRFFAQPSDQIRNDVSLFQQGRPIDWRPYISDELTLGQLLIEIPHVQHAGKLISLRELREIFVTDPKSFDVHVFSEKRGLFDIMQSAQHRVIQREADALSAAQRRSELGISESGSTIVMRGVKLPSGAAIKRDVPLLYALDQIVKEVQRNIGAKEVVPTYYFEVGQSDGHASRFGTLGLNLDTYFRRNQSILKEIVDEKLDVTHSTVRTFLAELIDLLTHERRHNVEGTDAFSHDATFFEGQRDILGQFIKKGANFGKVLKRLHSLTPTEVSPEEIVKILA